MIPLFTYLLKSTITLVMFFILYKLTMSNEKSHKLNRFLLLGILFVSALIPFVQIPVFHEKSIIKPVEFVREVFVPDTQFSEFLAPVTKVDSISETSGIHINLWLILYLVVILFLIFRLTVSVFRISQLYKGSKRIAFSQYILAIVKDYIQPFSILKHIFISEKDFKSNNDILITHEVEHIGQKHFIDLLLVEVFTLMHWFNPFMWFLRRELKLVHEYLADQAVIEKGINAQKYQLLVLEKAVGEKRFAMANYFTQKPILKRIKMMKKKNINRYGSIKLLLFLPLTFFLLQAFIQPDVFQTAGELIPFNYEKEKQEGWLEKWTFENIGKGFFQPEMKPEDLPTSENNLLVILMNAKDEYLIEGQHYKKAEIKTLVKDFLYGKNPDGKKGPDYSEKQIQKIGKLKVSQGVISYKHDFASSPEMVNKTLNNIGEAYFEVRNEKAQILFDQKYFALNNEEQETVKLAVPIWFLYENPQPPAPSVWLPFENKPSPLPEPLEIFIKNNGEVYIENFKYENFEEFSQSLENWKVKLEKFNEGKNSKGFYRAHLIYEPEVPQSEHDKYNILLYRNNIQVGQIKVLDEPLKLLLQNNKLEKRILDVQKKTSSVLEEEKQDTIQVNTFSIFSIFNVELYRNKIVVNKEVLSFDDLLSKATSLHKDFKENCKVTLSIKENVPKERIDKIHEIFQKANIGVTQDFSQPMVKKSWQKKYDSIKAEGSLFLVSKNGKNGLLDEKEKVLVPLEFDYIEIYEKAFVASNEGHFSVYEINGELRFSGLFDDVWFDELNQVFVEENGLIKMMVSFK